MQEAREGLIELHEDEPDAVAAMIEFLYTGLYTTPATFRYHRDGVLASTAFNMALLSVADKYDLPVLAKTAADQVILGVGRKWQAPILTDVIEFVYEIVPYNAIIRDMRTELVKICVKGQQILLERPMHAAFQAAVNNIPFFGIDFSHASMAAAKEKHKAELERMTTEFKAACEMAKVGSDEARMRCSSPTCGRMFVAQLPAGKRHCPYCATPRAHVTLHTLGDEVEATINRLRRPIRLPKNSLGRVPPPLREGRFAGPGTGTGGMRSVSLLGAGITAPGSGGMRSASVTVGTPAAPVAGDTPATPATDGAVRCESQ